MFSFWLLPFWFDQSLARLKTMLPEANSLFLLHSPLSDLFLLWIAFHPAYLTTSVLKPEPNLLSGRRFYKWEEKAHCSSIIWHDIIWRPPKTDFWVNSWKYFQTGTNFWQKSDCMAGLEIFWLETFLERCCAADSGQSLFLAELKSRD